MCYAAASSEVGAEEKEIMKERAYIARIERLNRPEDNAADNHVVIVVPITEGINPDVHAEQIAADHGYTIVELHSGDKSYEVARA
jgi:hypothetical protein